MQSLIKQARASLGTVKPYLRWAILGGTFFFVVTTLRQNWQDVTSIELQESGLACLTIAVGVTLLSHIWSGWVWGWILQDCRQTIRNSWSVKVYLKTNIAKYLPGNIWHYYGRISAARVAGIPISIAALSIILEPLLMAAAALIIALGSYSSRIGIWSLLLVIVLIGLHPRMINPILRRLQKIEAHVTQDVTQINDIEKGQATLQQYPWRLLAGELGFVSLRSLGFLLTMLALQPVSPHQITVLVSAFSFSWLLGLVVPGAPGGLGVFEATAISLLSQEFSAGLILGVVALYRLISIIAEIGGAGLAWLDERLDHQHFIYRSRTFR